MDSRGNMTLEIAIALIVILMILGLALSLGETSMQKISKQTETEHIETFLEESVDNLINNPGSPENWEVRKKGTPGLAIVSEEGHVIPNSVSYVKLTALGSNYKKLADDKLFNLKIKTSMELIPHRSGVSSVKIGNTEDSNNVHSVNRLVKCDYYKKYVLRDFENEGKCNHKHDQKSHSCSYFKVFKSSLKKNDYYLLIDNSESHDLKYYIASTRLAKDKYFESPVSNRIYLNDEIDLYGDSSAVEFIHLDKANAKAVLVSVPKNFDRDKLKYEYFTTNDCDFVLKAWY